VGFCAAVLWALLGRGGAAEAEWLDRERYGKVLGAGAARRIDSEARRMAAAISRWFAARASPEAILGESRREEDRSAEWEARLGPPLRRTMLLVANAPLFAMAILDALLLGLVARRAALEERRWRSPTLAYLSKRFAAWSGAGGLAFFAAAPAGMPLWLAYPFAGSLCGGLALYVSSLGRI